MFSKVHNDQYKLLFIIVAIVLMALAVTSCGSKKKLKQEYQFEQKELSRITTVSELPAFKLTTDYKPIITLAGDTIERFDTIIEFDQKSGALLKMYRDSLGIVRAECEALQKTTRKEERTTDSKEAVSIQSKEKEVSGLPWFWIILTAIVCGAIVFVLKRLYLL